MVASDMQKISIHNEIFIVSIVSVIPRQRFVDLVLFTKVKVEVVIIRETGTSSHDVADLV